MATIDHWEEWKKQCAIALCSNDARRDLESFAFHRWTRFLQTIFGYDSPELTELKIGDIWHRFETWCCVSSTSSGKAYKDWMFGRLETHVGTPLDIIQSGATLLLRDVVRDFVRHEGRMRLPGRRAPEISLNEPIAGIEGDLTYADLLPAELDADSQLIVREYQRLAEQEASELLPRLVSRERLVLAASALGIPMSNPRLARIAGKKKSVLSSTLQRVEDRIKQHIDKKYTGEQEGDRRVLCIATLRQLRNVVCDPKNSPETWRAELFNMVYLDD